MREEEGEWGEIHEADRIRTNSDALPKMSTSSLKDTRKPITKMKLLKFGCKNNIKSLRVQLYLLVYVIRAKRP